MESKGFNYYYKQYLYYGVIGIISFIALVFLPMIGSEAEIGFKLPQTAASWTVFITTRIIVSVINILIFHSFMEQAKINVKDNEDYKKANEILKRVKEANIKKPLSPNKWTAKQYLHKGTLLFISSLLATFAISQAILSYDWMQLLSYILTITMAVIFGVLQMKKAETYWIFEYYQYAIDYQEAYEKKLQEDLMRAEELKKIEQSNINVNEEIIIKENSDANV